MCWSDTFLYFIVIIEYVYIFLNLFRISVSNLIN